MANYTITLRDILRDEQSKAEIDKALSTYPLYVKKSQEEFIPCYIPTREELNTKLLNHFKYREIGFDTIGRFIDELEIAMVEIMPRYNLLFHSIDQDFDIKFNVDYTRTTDTDKTGSNSNTVESENTLSNEMNGNTSSETIDTTSSTNEMENSSNNTSTTTSKSESENETSNTSSTNSTTTTENTTKDTISSSDTSSGREVITNTPQNTLSIPKTAESQSYADSVKWNDEKTDRETESNATNNGKSIASATGSTTATSSDVTDLTSNSTDVATSTESVETSSRGTTTNTTTSGETTTTNGNSVVEENGNRSEKELTTERTMGNFGVVSSQDLIMKYRESIINVEQMIMYDPRIQELFMLIY